MPERDWVVTRGHLEGTSEHWKEAGGQQGATRGKCGAATSIEQEQKRTKWAIRKNWQVLGGNGGRQRSTGRAPG